MMPGIKSCLIPKEKYISLDICRSGRDIRNAFRVAAGGRAMCHGLLRAPPAAETWKHKVKVVYLSLLPLRIVDVGQGEAVLPFVVVVIPQLPQPLWG